MDLLPVVPSPRFGRLPSWKISNDHISGTSYPIHFRELQSSIGGIQEKLMREEYLDWSQSKIFLVRELTATNYKNNKSGVLGKTYT